MRRAGIRGAVAAGALAALAALVLWGGGFGWIPDGQAVRAWLASLGGWGPVAIVAMRAVAVVIAVVPNAPITAAAGAAYGQIWGSAYVLAGAEIGAIAAFLIGRGLGYGWVRSWPWLDRPRRSRIGRWLLDPEQSQNKLTGLVFLIRLTPLLNMDVISYVAGLTRISLWRFALATFLGMLPYNLAIVFLGHRLASTGGLHPWIWIGIAGLALTPVLGRLAWTWWRKRREGRPGAA